MKFNYYNMNESWKKGDWVLPDNSWKELFDNIDFNKVNSDIQKELDIYGNHIEFYPPKQFVFNAFCKTSEKDIKVVILGQDPYINFNQATGLAFSVPEGEKLPPSLKNIYKKFSKKTSGDLTYWAEQGVLLLNTSLSVRAGNSNSHSKIWKNTTDYMIQYISDNCDDIVFILWGRNALNKKKLINESKHHLLISSHPSPLSYTKTLAIYKSFADNNHFYECNEILQGLGKHIIYWDYQPN